MRDPAKEQAQQIAERQAAQAVSLQAASKAAATVLETPAGRELFDYLAKKYHLRGRSFLTASSHAASCPFAAASRDGEKAVLNHVYDLARNFDPNTVIP